MASIQLQIEYVLQPVILDIGLITIQDYAIMLKLCAVIPPMLMQLKNYVLLGPIAQRLHMLIL